MPFISLHLSVSPPFLKMAINAEVLNVAVLKVMVTLLVWELRPCHHLLGLGSLTTFPWGSLWPRWSAPPEAPALLCLRVCPQLGTPCDSDSYIWFAVCGLSPLLVSSLEHKLLRPRLCVSVVLWYKLSGTWRVITEKWHWESDSPPASLQPHL